MKYHPHKVILALLYGVICLRVCVHSAFDYTNVVCNALDKPFADFEYCFLKSINRSYKYMSLKVKLFDVPITNVTVNIALLKKENGYKPFLYNVTVDACKYLKQSNKNSLYKFLYSFFSSHSNMNHSCPFVGDLVVEKLPASHLSNLYTNVLPFPPGEYAFYTGWIAYNKLRAEVTVFGKVY